MVTTAAILVVAVALLPALWACRSHLRTRKALVLLLILVGAAYPLIPAGHITVTTAEVTDRSAGFVFLGVGFVLALWLVGRPGLRNRVPAVVVLPTLAVIFVGGIVFGAGTTSTQLPGRFLVSADSRSIDAQSLQAAQWLHDHLTTGSRLYADRVDGLLAAAVGGQQTVTHIGSGVDASRILLAPTFTDKDRTLIKAAHIAYVVVDERDATGLPNEQVYAESGEYGGTDRTRPVTIAALRKLEAVPGVRRIFDNGDLVVYDVRALDGH